LGIDLVDDCTGSASALIIHAGDLLFLSGFRIFLKDDDLGILPAQLHHGTCGRIQLLHGQRYGIYFLNKFGTDKSSQRPATTPGNEDSDLAKRDLRKLLFNPLQKLQHFFGLLGVVALVVTPNNLVSHRVNNHGFDSCRAHVESNEQGVKTSHSADLIFEMTFQKVPITKVEPKPPRLRASYRPSSKRLYGS